MAIRLCQKMLAALSQQNLGTTVFLYGAETWTVNAVDVKRIDALDQWCLRRICGIRWDDFITNEEVRRRTNQMPLSLKVARRRLMLFGHWMRRDEKSDTSRILRTEVDKEWKRPRGRPRSTWISTVTNDLKRQGLDVDFPAIMNLARDRRRWQEVVHRATPFERLAS